MSISRSKQFGVCFGFLILFVDFRDFFAIGLPAGEKSEQSNLLGQLFDGCKATVSSDYCSICRIRTGKKDYYESQLYLCLISCLEMLMANTM